MTETPATKRPIVHIGYHKTATTWFQKVFYPAVHDGAYLQRKLVRQLFLEPRVSEFNAAASRTAVLDACAGRQALLCEENLSGYIHNGGLGGLVPAMAAERLHQSLPEAQIVVFLREQASMVAASYVQYVRSGGTRKPLAYIGSQGSVTGARSHWYKVPLFDLDHFNYGPMLDHYARLFGREAVHVFLYEDFTRDPPAFIDRFCARLNLTVDLKALDFSVRNPSLSIAGLRLMRRLNRFTRQSVIDKDVLISLPGWYDRRWAVARGILGSRLEGRSTSEQLFGADMVASIRDHFAVANRDMARRWNLPLERAGYAIGNG